MRRSALRLSARAWSAAALLVAAVASSWTGVLVAQAPDGPTLTAHQTARVERMLETRVACLGCHRIDGRGGMIGPVLDGLADRSTRDVVLRMIRDPAGTVPGTTMPAQVIPAGEAERLATYLMSLPADVDGPPPATVPGAPRPLEAEDRLNGAALYARHCAACHGSSGMGDGWNAANLPAAPTAHADPALMTERTDDTLYDAIHAGGYVLDRSARMPAFGEMLDPEQIRALVAHIRTLCACEQPTWARGG